MSVVNKRAENFFSPLRKKKNYSLILYIILFSSPFSEEKDLFFIFINICLRS